MRTLRLTVDVGSDPGETDRLTRQLLTELLELDLDRAELTAQGAIPSSAKGADPATVTTIIVGLASSQVLVQLGRVLQSVVTRSKDRKIIVQDGDRRLEITGASDDDNRRVIDEFFER